MTSPETLLSMRGSGLVKAGVIEGAEDSLLVEGDVFRVSLRNPACSDVEFTGVVTVLNGQLLGAGFGGFLKQREGKTVHYEFERLLGED